jgi:8-oxo-dGTP pyrophosphatase MutT (NUDIX family)
MDSDIPEFGLFTNGVLYILRPGGYAVIVGPDGLIAIAVAPGGLFLPGGAQEEGETPERAALREAREECGLEIAIRASLGFADELVYDESQDQHFRKRCAFFLAEAIGHCTRRETDYQLMWLSIEEAKARLRHKSQRWAVEQGCRMWNAAERNARHSAGTE